MMRVLENQWYPVLESRELRRKPLGVERLGRQLMFWRTTDGLPHAHFDRCPHLGAALSGGKIMEDHLVCPFHGFEFDRDGKCKHIPAIGRKGKISKEIEARHFPLREAFGFIWLWWGKEPESYPELPYFNVLKVGWQYGTIVTEWPVHYTRAIENQLDVAHLPFVHRTTIGASGHSFVEGPYLEADEQGIKVWVTNSKDEGQRPRSPAELAESAATNEPGLHFLFPGIWLLNLSPRLKNFIAFVPINEQKTRYYLRVYHHVCIPLSRHLFEMLMGISNRFILNQDKRVVLTQTPLDSSDAHQDRLIRSDRAVSQFRRLHARLLKEEAPSCQQKTIITEGLNTSSINGNALDE